MIFQAMTITFLVKQLWFWLVGSFVTFGLFFYFYNKSNNLNGKSNSMPVLVTSFFGIVLTFSSIWYFGIHTQPTAMSKTKDVATQAKTKFQEWQEKRRQNKENKESNSGFKFPKFRTKKQEPVDLTEFTKEFNNALGTLEDCGRKLKANDTILDGLIGQTVKDLEELAEKQKNIEKAKEVVAAAKRRIEEEIEKLKGKIAGKTAEKTGHEAKKKTAEEKRTQANQDKDETEEKIANEKDEATRNELKKKLAEITTKIGQLDSEITSCEREIKQCDLALGSLNKKLGFVVTQLTRIEKQEADLTDKQKQALDDAVNVAKLQQELEALKAKNKDLIKKIEDKSEQLFALKIFIETLNRVQNPQTNSNQNTNHAQIITDGVVDVAKYIQPISAVSEATQGLFKCIFNYTHNESLTQIEERHAREEAKLEVIRKLNSAEAQKNKILKGIGEDYIYLFDSDTHKPIQLTQPVIDNLVASILRQVDYLKKQTEELTVEEKNFEQYITRVEKGEDPGVRAWENYYARRKLEKQKYVDAYNTQILNKKSIKENKEKIIKLNPALIEKLKDQKTLFYDLLDKDEITPEDLKTFNKAINKIDREFDDGIIIPNKAKSEILTSENVITMAEKLNPDYSE